MTCNFKKTVCMVFTPKRRDKIISRSFPVFTIGGIHGNMFHSSNTQDMSLVITLLMMQKLNENLVICL